MSNINPGTSDYPATGTKTNSTSRSSNLGNRVRGAAEFIHGAGENVRGTLLATVDTIIEPESGETKNDELAYQGRLEMERGLAKMKGQGVGVGTSDTDVNHDVAYPHGNRASAWTDGQHPVGDDKLHGGSVGPGGEVAAAAAYTEPNRTASQAQGSQNLDPNRRMEMPRSSVQQQPESEIRGGYPAQQTHSTETQYQSHNPSGLPYPPHHRDDAISGVSQGQLNEIKPIDERRAHGGGQPQLQQDDISGAHPSSGPEVGALRDRDDVHNVPETTTRN